MARYNLSNFLLANHLNLNESILGFVGLFWDIYRS